MSVYIETFFNSLNKYGEELCGDKAEIIRNNESVIIVLADGLGSGVKANILATLTGKIIATMLNEDADIDECLETIASTLPVCSERGIAYSTFTILKICNTGEAYLAEYDNPETVFIRKGKISALNKTLRTIKDKNIRESHFVMEPDDMLILFSDGVVHAGVGKLLNLGWQYENVLEYIQNAVRPDLTSRTMCRQLVSACDSLYAETGRRYYSGCCKSTEAG
jgi:serine phosphatase RsbU (regulator of sigma subunit)